MPHTNDGGPAFSTTLRMVFTNEVIRAIGALAKQQAVCREQDGQTVFMSGMDAAREYIVEHVAKADAILLAREGKQLSAETKTTSTPGPWEYAGLDSRLCPAQYADLYAALLTAIEGLERAALTKAEGRPEPQSPRAVQDAHLREFGKP